MKNSTFKIDAKGMHYRDLNIKVKEAIFSGEKNIELINVNGQRFIGDGISSSAKIIVNGIPGNDLCAFTDGITVEVNGNCQDGVGNTMNQGRIICQGNAGDVLGYAMRDGKIFVKGDVGYRVGIHMKSYKEHIPTIVIGGSAGDFLGEYMAGGVIIMLNLDGGFDGDYIGTGMHGGVIYIRGKVDEAHIGEGVGVKEVELADEEVILSHVKEFCKYFNCSEKEIMNEKFIKLVPISTRPYGRLYSY